MHLYLENIFERNGRSILLTKVVIEVRHKDKTGQWKRTNSLNLSDLPKAILALQKAFEYLMDHKQPEQVGNPENLELLWILMDRSRKYKYTSAS